MLVGKYVISEELLYTKEHEWVRTVGRDRAVIGITDYAAKMLHDIIYVSLPQMGQEVKSMVPIGSVESIKTVSDVYSPLSGRIVKINEALNTSPELVAQSPYQEGWLVEIIPTRLDEEMQLLLTPEDYGKLIEELSRKKE